MSSVDIEDVLKNESCGFARPEFRNDDTVKDSVKCVDAHVFVLRSDEPSSWSAKIASFLPIPEIKSAVESENKDFKVKVTVAHEFPLADDTEETANDVESAPAAESTVLAFPIGAELLVRHEQAHFDELARVLTGQTALDDVSSVRVVRRLSEQRLLFVCSHSQKDERCGACGNALVAKVRGEKVDADRLRLFGCSHVGGHKYAGNVLAFANGNQSRWFGFVGPDVVPDLLSFAADTAEFPSDPTQLPDSLQPLYRGSSFKIDT
eukprot:TRINITY_DN5523_c0_g1_i1.p1 TRINITY_DN5523_c0_g1~~TRINITY_DN5523_c0_g1_i1.p1  ORF type:complete len:264 (-),score=85.07 TRINITY_DN5523_c0_g1_i1:74-865(-)